MSKLIFGLSVVLGFVYLIARSNRRSAQFQAWSRVEREWQLMFQKLEELRDDPTMSDLKWAKWLPVFEYMDRYYARHNFLGAHVSSLAELVREEIDDDRYLQGMR